MRIGKKAFSGHQLADLLVLVGLASFVLWYFVDTYKASSHTLNLILVLPVTLIVLALCLVEFLETGFRETITKRIQASSSLSEALFPSSLFLRAMC